MPTPRPILALLLRLVLASDVDDEVDVVIEDVTEDDVVGVVSAEDV